MIHIVKRVRLWWATTKLTAEDHAVLAWESRSTPHNQTYRDMLHKPAAMTQVLAEAAYGMAVRHQN